MQELFVFTKDLLLSSEITVGIGVRTVMLDETMAVGTIRTASLARDSLVCGPGQLLVLALPAARGELLAVNLVFVAPNAASLVDDIFATYVELSCGDVHFSRAWSGAYEHVVGGDIAAEDTARRAGNRIHLGGNLLLPEGSVISHVGSSGGLDLGVNFIRHGAFVVGKRRECLLAGGARKAKKARGCPNEFCTFKVGMILWERKRLCKLDREKVILKYPAMGIDSMHNQPVCFHTGPGDSRVHSHPTSAMVGLRHHALTC